MNKIEKLDDLKSALSRLEESLKDAKTDLEQDGAIQRFEFTYELAWKCIQEYAQISGVDVISPRDAFRVAAELKLISDPEKWFKFIKDRNEASHIYSKAKADEIFSHLPDFVSEVESLIENLNSL